jgi:hypothetical protein
MMVDPRVIKRKQAKIKKLNVSGQVRGDLWEVVLGVDYALKDPKALTDDAILTIACIHPVHVIEEGSRFVVVANNRIALLLKRLPPETVIPVMVWPRREFIPTHTSVFLSVIAFGLDPRRDLGILNLYDAHSEKERLRISPWLKSRTGLENLTGVSRKIKAFNPQIINSKTEQLSLGWGENNNVTE